MIRSSYAALTRLPVGGLDNSDGRALIGLIGAEAVAAAQASGVKVDESRILGKIDYVLANHRTHEPSISQDFRAGRLTEIETINGAIVRIAKEYGMAASANQTVACLVRLAQTGRKGSTT